MTLSATPDRLLAWVEEAGWLLESDILEAQLEALGAAKNELIELVDHGAILKQKADAASNGARSTGSLLDVYNLTDVGNAERLVAAHGEDLKYVPGLGWHVWDGRRFRRDDDGEVIRRMKATVRDLLAASALVDDDDRRKKLTQHALRSEAERQLRAAVTLAATDQDVIARLENLDVSPWLLNVANGTVHLNAPDGPDLVPHQRGNLLTKLTPIKYEPDATAPTWDAFLERVLGGDQDLIAFVQRAVGYTLTGSTREQVIFLLHGTGANGKTTFIETLRALFGEYGLQTPAETFLERRDTIPNDIARLPGARFVAATETGEGRRLNETMVKRLVGGDSIPARFMHREWFEFVPVFKAWIATNHLPNVRGTDEAIWRRIRLIPFTVTIPEGERDRELAFKLLAELPGILRWAVDGALSWQLSELGDAHSVTAATSAYRTDMDILGSFLDECCVVTNAARAKAGDLYAAYTAWADRAGERDRLSQQAFGRALKERGFEQTRAGGARWWAGLGLTLEAGQRDG